MSDKAWTNCFNCGYRYGSWISNCTQCQAENKATGNGIGIKKIAIGAGIGVAAIFAVLIVVGFVFGNSNHDNISGNTSKESQVSQISDTTIVRKTGNVYGVELFKLSKYPPGSNTFGMGLILSGQDGKDVAADGKASIAITDGTGMLLYSSTFPIAKSDFKETPDGNGIHRLFYSRFFSASELKQGSGSYGTAKLTFTTTNTEDGSKEETFTAINNAIPISSSSSSTNTNSGSNLFTGSVLDFYPVRSDIGTGWTIDKAKIVAGEGYDGPTSNMSEEQKKTYLHYNSPWISEVGKPSELDGFIQAAEGTYKADMTIHLVTMKFDSYEHAHKPYLDKTKALYEQGGFSQMDVSSINAECFGKWVDVSGINQHVQLYCVKENVIFYITNEWVANQGTVTQFAKIVASKIS